MLAMASTSIYAYYWTNVHKMADVIDERIDAFNRMTGLAL